MASEKLYRNTLTLFFLIFSFFSYARAYHAPDLFTVFIACVANVETGLPLPSPPLLAPTRQPRVFLGF